jgi:hypothetical protein
MKRAGTRMMEIISTVPHCKRAQKHKIDWAVLTGPGWLVCLVRRTLEREELRHE